MAVSKLTNKQNAALAWMRQVEKQSTDPKYRHIDKSTLEQLRKKKLVEIKRGGPPEFNENYRLTPEGEVFGEIARAMAKLEDPQNWWAILREILGIK